MHGTSGILALKTARADESVLGESRTHSPDVRCGYLEHAGRGSHRAVAQGLEPRSRTAARISSQRADDCADNTAVKDRWVAATPAVGRACSALSTPHSIELLRGAPHAQDVLLAHRLREALNCVYDN